MGELYGHEVVEMIGTGEARSVEHEHEHQAVQIRPEHESCLLEVFKTIDVEPVRGEGVYLYDARGRRYLDFYGGHAVSLLGNTHRGWQEALRAQAEALIFQSNLVPLRVRENAAARLLAFGPPGLSKVFFVNSGAEANENALRMAFLATRRSKVVCVQGGFHGRSCAAAAVTTGHEAWYAFPHAPFEVVRVPFDDVEALHKAVHGDTAACILEPVQGMAGARPLSTAFLRAARERTEETGTVLIFDEVQCGMGRTGYPFAAQSVGIVPDILTTAKGLAGGYPAGALMCTESLSRAVHHGDLGTTFGGGPLPCALIVAVLDAIATEDLLASVRRLSARLMNECVTGPVEGVQGLGFLLGLRTRPPAAAVIAALRERRILVGGSTDPHVVRLLPPLVLQDEHVDILVHALKELSC
jgi:acetylornithine/succinyldiaminopimelate/putrescine aminotransferase